MRSVYLAYGLLGLLCISVGVAACGSDPDKKVARAEQGGAGGGAGVPGNSSGGGRLDPNGGAGGQLPVGGGGGGMPSMMGGNGGAPVEAMAGSGEGGAAGSGSTLPPLPAFDCTTIGFTDANLDDQVRFWLDKAAGEEITPAEAATLTALQARDARIEDLSGIECLVNLESLDLAGGETPNMVADVGPLAYLSKLKTLNLSDNPVTDLSPLVYLGELTELTLSDLSTVPDLTPVGQLPKLQTLEIEYDSAFAKPESLAALRNISKLLAVATIDDASLIGTLTQLRHLELGYKPLANPNDLGGLGNLTYLDVLDMGLTSAAPFATLTELTHLDLRESPITDVGPLQNLTGLQDLNLFATSITSVKPLVDNQGLSNGDTVDISNTPLDCAEETSNLNQLAARGVTLVGSPCTL
jgi:Leucine-rich repeat (LRR) protein